MSIETGAADCLRTVLFSNNNISYITDGK